MKKMVVVKDYAKLNHLVQKRVGDNSLFLVYIMSYMIFYKNT
jgi:hypothetical protein